MPKHLHLAAPLLAAAVLVAGCGSSQPDPAPSSAASDGSDADAPGGATEQRRAAPRLAITYEGGVQIVDAGTLRGIADIPGEGYLRVNPAGDGRHAFLSEGTGFRLLDLGAWSVPHGDHQHFYTAAPRRTDIRIEAPEPGHVVRHDGRTVLFSDGTGAVTSIPSDKIGDPNAPRATYTAPKPHHGVAVERADGSMLITLGDEKTRTGVAILDKDRKEIARNEECAGVHGEGAAEGGVVLFGCEDGVLIVRGNEIVKTAAPTPGYARTGNVAATEAHAVVLGDYKVDKAAKPERPTRVSLIDTRTGAVKLVDLPASYSFRSLARGQFGEALVLGTDGVLRILDPETGAVVREVKATAPWTEDANWQEPRPAVFVLGSTAFVTEPTTKTIVAIDIPSGSELRRGTLEHTPDEVSGVTGVSATH
ncbi:MULTISPECIES: hypothetical protein [Tsukamurella]|uniref:PQQ-binding-like beta-propeller repeat protein n=2 Tax=Tsukamurella TaxID=2060 RepID=A0A5C5RXI6_9ACTN|nr:MULTISPECIES: hypothetical protein [Tsukamurella]NMD57306.1 hypothetical protein [Tsukamurella columbiensis]TWS27786.1 hypothetical protein FK530_16680 [Tsukamurella conjunctivitidis]